MKSTHEVFGMSNHILPDSYVDRGALDGQVQSLLGRRLHIAIRGPSKCGKSWLRQKVSPNALIVQCRLNSKVIDIYESALHQLGVKLITESTEKHSIKGTLEASGSAGSELIAKVAAKLGLEGNLETTQKHVPIGQKINDLNFISQIIIESKKRLIIEDVHYLSLDERELLAHDLKTLWDFGCFTTIVGVWGESNMFIRLNSELSTRIEEISLEWGPDDLRNIIKSGCDALNIEIERSIQNQIIIDCFGNAGLLQTLILRTLDEAKINKKEVYVQKVEKKENYRDAAMHIADQLNGIYIKFGERVAAGIRSRSDSTGIYAHAMAAIVGATDEMHLKGIPLEYIYKISNDRQPRILKTNLKTILSKIDALQVDKNGKGLVVTYDPDLERVLNVDRQLLFYRKYLTVSWPWEELIAEAEKVNSN